MAQKIAVDFVLLPPKEVMDLAIELNHQIVSRSGDKGILLNKRNCLPHITLLQTVIELDQISKINQLIQSTANKFSPIPLRGIFQSGAISAFAIESQTELQRLHEIIVKNFGQPALKSVKAEYFFDKEVRKKTLEWVSDFMRNETYKNYKPHITLGIGKLDNMDKTINFTAGRLAVCHLGNYNTCRKILIEAQLG